MKEKKHMTNEDVIAIIAVSLIGICALAILTLLLIYIAKCARSLLHREGTVALWEITETYAIRIAGVLFIMYIVIKIAEALRGHN